LLAVAATACSCELLRGELPVAILGRTGIGGGSCGGACCPMDPADASVALIPDTSIFVGIATGRGGGRDGVTAVAWPIGGAS